MFKFRVFITAFLLLAVLFSVQSNAVQITQNLSPAVNSHTLFTAAVDITKTEHVTESAGVPAHKKTDQTDFSSHQPRLTANNSSLFLHIVQSEPEYDVVYEFFAQHLVRQIFLPPQAVNVIQPWYTFVHNSKKSRLSGWKDANLLYKAVTTYNA